MQADQLTDAAIDALSGRDLDAAIAEHVLKWKPCKIGPDYDGENECEILTPDGTLGNGYEPPRRGKLPRGLLAPMFHKHLDIAIRLSQQFGNKSVSIEADLSEIPTLISRMVLKQVCNVV